MEHCLFYSGEVYKVCENEKFLSQGLKAAKDAHKRKSSMGSYPSLSSPHAQKPNSFARGKQTGPQNFGGVGRANQGYGGGGGSNNWGTRISEKSLWLSLINKLSKTSLLPVCKCRNLHSYKSLFWGFLFFFNKIDP